MPSPFDLIALSLLFAAGFGFLNHRFLHLPQTIALLIIAFALSLAVVAVDTLVPGLALREDGARILKEINLPAWLLDGALSFLLFAGALHVGWHGLWRRKWTILLLATLGVMLNAALLGTAMWWVFGLTGHPVPFLWCLTLGTVLAPTDPVAVLGVLERVGLPDTLRATVAGESMFNDGVAVVLAGAVAGIAADSTLSGGRAPPIDAVGIAGLMGVEMIGGAALGLLAGGLAFAMLRRIDNDGVEVMISLALASGTYSLAQALHVSGPIAVVAAGLIIGNLAVHHAMSDTTRRKVESFWMLVDDVLNAQLFLLIGFEVILVPFETAHLAAAAGAVLISPLARLVSVVAPTIALHLHSDIKMGAVAVLTWGGLRGGISVALALSLPDSPFLGEILAATYGVVVFTIVVQGLTLERVAKTFFPTPSDTRS